MKAQQIGEISRAGGFRGSPNSIAALMRCQVPYALQRHCQRGTCRQTACRGSDFCRFHGGIPARGKTRGDQGGRPESRLLANMETAGLLPFDLLAHPAWRGLTGLPRAKRAPLRLLLLQAWDRRDKAPLMWAQVQRQAMDAASDADLARGSSPWLDVA